MNEAELVIGNKNYSSWSLRAWLALRKAGAEFRERRLSLDTPEFYAEIADYSPTGQVPVLWDGPVCTWDSLAIAEYANDRWAQGRLWPQDTAARARARAVSAEMHAGFSELRSVMPMNCRARNRRVPMSSRLEADINRIISIWCECLEKGAGTGGWLFGDFSIADAMYAPVVFRFQTYGVELPGPAASYAQHVLADPDITDWTAAAELEQEVVEADEAGH